MKKTTIYLLAIALILGICLAVVTATAEGARDLPGNGGTGGRQAKPLTYADLGIKVPEEQTSKAGYLHPQTFVITEDNEDNAHSGNPDYDMDTYLFAEDYKAPIEVRFDLETLPGRDAFICIYAWDCDEYNGDTPEYDAIYVNDTRIGAMTGQDDEWNTTYWSVPVSALRKGANYVTIHIGRVDKTVTPWEYVEDYPDWWAIQVKWVQLLLDGGSSEEKPEKFSVNLQNATLNYDYVYCDAVVEIESSKERNYEVEYSLVDRSSPDSETYMQIISTDVSTVTGTTINTYGTLYMPLQSPQGLYSVQVMLRDQDTYEILAADEKYFTFDGTLPSFDITNLKAELSDEEYTPGPITMYVSADISDPSVVSNVKFWLNGEESCKAKINKAGHATGSFEIIRNGEYEVELRYVKDGKELSARIYVTVANIINGDVNGDKKIDDDDCTLVREYLLGKRTLKKDQLARADMDDDGIVTGVDYLLIRSFILGH